jgi:hypothetical protein
MLGEDRILTFSTIKLPPLLSAIKKCIFDNVDAKSIAVDFNSVHFKVRC